MSWNTSTAKSRAQASKIMLLWITHRLSCG